MTARCLMVQGTASSVGKSVLVAALCRIFRQDGFDVAPFKAQNMSNNSYATADGLEIGRAQAVQAEAAGIEPTVDMNPILLKPEADNRSQVVVRGRPLDRLDAQAYYAQKDRLWVTVTESLDRLRTRYDVIVIEGAGSPAEVNLRDRDIVNMRVATYCAAPVLLIADIDRGGIFASIIGTLTLLTPEERAFVKGIVINKFRGDLSLFEPGIEWLEQTTGVPVAGVFPYWHDLRVAEEDSMSIERRRALWWREGYLLDIAVIGLPHISNFDDFDPLEQRQAVRLRYVERGDPLGRPDLIILPGTKSTVADLDYLRRTGQADRLVEAANHGTPIIGICGGYQILGETVLDPDALESDRRTVPGLGLLPVVTEFERQKSTHRIRARVLAVGGLFGPLSDAAVGGYEIHMGQTRRLGGQAVFEVEERSGVPVRSQDGCANLAGTVLGTYVHGLFENEVITDSVLKYLAQRKGVSLESVSHEPSAQISPVLSKQQHLDLLAERVRGHLDMGLVYRTMGLSPHG